MEKKKISAKEFIEDIRFGLDDSTLIKKYKISSKDKLTKLFDKLLDTGHITKTEIHRRYKTFICPSCGETQLEEIVECQYCGIILSKYVEKVKRDYKPLDKYPLNKITEKKNITTVDKKSKGSVFGFVDILLETYTDNKLKKVLTLCLFVTVIIGIKLLFISEIGIVSNSQLGEKKVQTVSPSKIIHKEDTTKPSEEYNDEEVLDSSIEDYDFRRTKWGMTKKKVMRSEKIDPECDNCFQSQSADSVLGYNSIIINKEVSVVYSFIDDQLVRGLYVLNEKHTNPNDYIDDYNNFAANLSNKYGDPAKEKIQWTNDTFKDSPDRKGLAVSMGHLGYISHWITPRTFIFLILSGDNYKTRCVIRYDSIKHIQLVSEKEAESKKDDF